MPFPIHARMTARQFEDGFINVFWSRARVSTKVEDPVMPLREAIAKTADLPKVNSPEALVDDYCRIASFLADRDAVLAALRPLEERLRNRVRHDLRQPIERYRPLQDPVFKTHKLLSSELTQFEMELGFNNPAVFSHLHSAAYVLGKNEGDGLVRKPWQPEERGRTTKDPIALPKGVPVSLGNVGASDFNRILLRHGYQFKDVGAGADHGEYSHRLQWHAVGVANIGLVNTPLQIFRSFGCFFNRGNVVPENPKIRFIYLWEAIFDSFPDAETARLQTSVAWCNGTFNSPNVLNTELCTIRADELAYLRVLLNVRKRKRLREQDLQSKSSNNLALDKLAQERYRVHEAIYTPKKEGERAGDSAGLLAWYSKT